MIGKIIIFLSLAGAAAITWIANLQYENIDLDKLFYSLAVIAISYFFLKLLLEEVIARSIENKKSRYTLRKTTQLLFIFVAFVVILRIWVVNPQALLVAYGLIAAGVAISLQDVFKNFAGALVILTTSIYRVGDRIEINSKYGDVIDIGLFYTTLLELREWVDGDQATGRISLLPNGQVLAFTVNNYTKDHLFIWDELSIPVTHSSNWKTAVEIMERVIKKETLGITKRATREISQLEEKYYLTKRNMEPKVYITPTDNWIMLRVRYVVDTRDRRIIQSDLYRLILELIQKEEGIEIASETLTVQKV